MTASKKELGWLATIKRGPSEFK